MRLALDSIMGDSSCIETSVLYRLTRIKSPLHTNCCFDDTHTLSLFRHCHPGSVNTSPSPSSSIRQYTNKRTTRFAHTLSRRNRCSSFPANKRGAQAGQLKRGGPPSTRPFVVRVVCVALGPLRSYASHLSHQLWASKGLELFPQCLSPTPKSPSR
jgi:hypothetical protein